MSAEKEAAHMSAESKARVAASHDPTEQRRARRSSLAVRTMAGVVALVAVTLVLLAASTLGVAGRVMESQLESNVAEAWHRTSGFVSVPRSNEGIPGSESPLPNTDTVPQATEGGLQGAEGVSQSSEPGDLNTEPRNPINAPGLPVGTVVLLESADGSVAYAGEIDASGQRTTLSSQDIELLRQAVGSHNNVTSQEQTLTRVELSSGTYLAQRGQLQSGQAFTLGLSTAQGDHTRSQLLIIQLVGCGMALIFVGLGVWWWIRRSLQPLRQVSHAAARVSQVPMSSGSVELERYRVPEELAQPRDEVGDVGYALNQLIDSVDSALAKRAASEEKLRAFIADASHELRTPLASVRGYAEMIQLTESLQDNGRKMLHRVLEQSERMSKLVENLLLLARLDAAEEAERSSRAKYADQPEHPSEPERLDGSDSRNAAGQQKDEQRSIWSHGSTGTRGAPRTFDLGELVIDAVMDATAAGRDHVWNTEIPDNSVLITGDATQISQLLANLLSNARKHTPAGTEVEVGLTVDGETAILTVADNGPGIAPELMGKLFDRFVRGDSVRTGTEGSTGLGLSVVRSVARAHGGETTVTSEPGRTKFRVVLPLATATAP